MLLPTAYTYRPNVVLLSTKCMMTAMMNHDERNIGYDAENAAPSEIRYFRRKVVYVVPPPL